MYQIEELDKIFLPVALNKTSDSISSEIGLLKGEYPGVSVIDLFSSQKKELFKIQHPRSRFSEEELQTMYNNWLGDKDPLLQGTWFFYPWNNKIIHLLEREEFVRLRTSRNHYKISPEEQTELSEKKIGIIGLSVGHAVAVSIATERICSKLKLADFDTVELSNLNRLKTGLHNIGLNKCIVTAREISEIDPFIEIECFTDGITAQNLPGFLLDGGKLDILIDECDDVEIKLASRQFARENNIPVVMETSDRGMLDVERFDLDPTRPIFHGLLKGIPDEKFRNILPQERLGLVMKIVEPNKGSVRGRASLLEVGQSISTWPQLASAVTLGGGVVTDVCRRILLNQFTDSGRYYVDLEELISNRQISEKPLIFRKSILPFYPEIAIRICDSLPQKVANSIPSSQQIEQLVEAASAAPSYGNDQPWKWVFRNGRLHLFHDPSRSFAFANVDNLSAYLSLGAAYENLTLKSKEMGLNVSADIFPLGSDSELVAVVSFHSSASKLTEPVSFPELAEFIHTRSTNRAFGDAQPTSEHEVQNLHLTLQDQDMVGLSIITDREQLVQIGSLAGECDLISILNEHGHYDFFERNIRWTPTDYSATYDGVPLQPATTPPAILATLSVLRDQKVAAALRKVGGGNAVVQATMQSLMTASCAGVLWVQKETVENYFLAGRNMQKLWLRSTQMGYTLQPVFSPVSLFLRLESGTDLDHHEKEKLTNLREIFRSITKLEGDKREVFLFKLSRTEKQVIPTKRLPLSEILFL
jgi:molybdopterin/thiamine biosynthesis adenylyltransferase/nitroreductase